MKNQQAAEREEQQRIKSLVLNYDLRDGEDQDGDSTLKPLLPNLNIHDYNTGLEKTAATTYTRPEKSGTSRGGQRSRKLQLSDVDWYDSSRTSSLSLDSMPVKENTRLSARGQKDSPVAFQPMVSASGRPSQLSRREILQEHASRKASLQPSSDK